MNKYMSRQYGSKSSKFLLFNQLLKNQLSEFLRELLIFIELSFEIEQILDQNDLII